MAEDLLARLQRRALVSGAVIAAAAMVITRDWRAGLAVLGGGLLVATSFVSIRGGIDGLAVRRRAGRAILTIAGRYALLAFLAYVMIVRLRLPPLGLIAGVSSIVVAVAMEAAQVPRKKP